MDTVKTFSRRSLFWLLFFMLLLLAVIDISAYLGAKFVTAAVPPDAIRAAADQSSLLKAGIERIEPVIRMTRTFFFPVTLFLFILFVLIEWLVVRGVFVRTIRKAELGKPVDTRAKVEKKKEGLSPEEEKALQEQRQRYYLHLLAVLQREGRLIDFLKEDLTSYDDAQIGAAVRSIHENCRKTLDRYLSPKPVMDQNEGDMITVPKNFDPGVIKLIGKVTGEPPFTGLLRHRGWRAAKLELPVLSGSGDLRIIAPAEVEIT